MRERIAWRAATSGAAVASVLTLALAGQLAATLLSVAAGGLVAGRLSRRAGALQGATGAAIWIGVVTLTGWANVPQDTVGVVLYDLAHLSAAAAAGWLGARLSS